MASKEPRAVTMVWVITAWLTPLMVILAVLVFMEMEREKDLERRDAVATANAISPELVREHQVFTEKVEAIVAASGLGSFNVEDALNRGGKFTSESVNMPPDEKGERPRIGSYESLGKRIAEGDAMLSSKAIDGQIAMLREWGKTLKQYVAYRASMYNYTLDGTIDPRDGRDLSEFRTNTSGTVSSDDESGEEGTEDVSSGESTDAISTRRLDEIRASLSRNSDIGSVSPGELSAAVNNLANVKEADKGDEKGKLLVKDPRVGVKTATMQTLILHQMGLIDELALQISVQDDVAVMNHGKHRYYAKLAKIMEDKYSALEAALNELESDNKRLDEETLMPAAESATNSAAAIESGDAQVGSGNLIYVFENVKESLDEHKNQIDVWQASVNRTKSTFRELLNHVKKIGEKYPLTDAYEVDGRIVTVDESKKLCYIDLGTANNIQSGMRFEVWNMNGMGAEELKGMIEVVRPISSSYALCVMLDIVDRQKFEEGDALINVLWEDGAYMATALHGANWGPPDTRYDKFSLQEKLKIMGVPVDERADANTRVVVLGAKAMLDTYYRKVKRLYDYDVFLEQRIQLYVDPR